MRRTELPRRTELMLLVFVLMPCNCFAQQQLDDFGIRQKPVPYVFEARISGRGATRQLLLMMPEESPMRKFHLKPHVIDPSSVAYSDAQASQLTQSEAAERIAKLQTVFVLPAMADPFEGIESLAHLAGGGVVPVLDARHSNQDPGSGGSIATVNGNGLEAGVFPARHKGPNVTGWLGRNTPNQQFDSPARFGWLHYDLGKAKKLTGLRIWGSNDIELRGRSVKDIKIFVTNDQDAFGDPAHKAWQEFAGLQDIPIGPGYEIDEPYGTTFEFDSTIESRFVRLDIESNWGNAFNTLLAEVQFYAKPDANLFLSFKGERKPKTDTP